MTIYDNKLFVAGLFVLAGDIPVNNIACWDGFKWCGFKDNFNNVILNISNFHDSLFITGGL